MQGQTFPQSLTVPINPAPNLKVTWMSCSGRFGTILSNFSIGLLVFSLLLLLGTVLSGLLTGIFAILIVLIIVIAVIFTLGLILLAVPEAWDQITNIFDYMARFTEKLALFSTKATPVCLVGAFVTAALAILFLALDKTRSHVGRIVISVLLLISPLLLFGFVLIAGVLE